MLIRSLFFLAILMPAIPTAFGQRELKDIPVPDPELERQTFRVPEGFEVTLFAADPRIAKPIQMNFDEDGRLWIVSSEVYPQIVPGQPATDRVIVLEDSDHDGVSDKTHIFADGLLIPTGIAPGDGGAYVANSTQLLHFADTDGNLQADSQRVVLSGFGTEDTHHILHTLRWGYDGYLYFNQSIYIHSHIETPWGVRRLNAGGIWQFRPETQELGVFARGLVNAWGHHFDRYGQSFATDGAGGEGINYIIPGAYYFTAADADRILQGLNPGSPKHCGLEILETPQLPSDWQGSAITCDFRGHRVVRFNLAEDGAGFVSREQQEVIWSDHVAFRPIDVKLGPDGAIYVADWYNPIIQHGEVDFRDERRDHTHGRIWRVRWTGAPRSEWQPNSARTNPELFELLRSPDNSQRQAARHVLKQRGTVVIPELMTWLAATSLTDDERDAVRLEALWCVQAARMVDENLLQQLLASRDGRVRAAAVRVLSHWKYQLGSSREWLAAAVTDPHPRVRLEAARAISFSPLQDSERQQQLTDAKTLEPINEAFTQSPLVEQLDAAANIELALGALRQPMDRFLDYGLWLTTREQAPNWLPAFRNGDVTFDNDADKIVFAFSAVGSGAPVELLLKGIYDARVTVEQQRKLVTLIGASGDAEQLGRLTEMAIDKSDVAALQIILAKSIDRKIIPQFDGDSLVALLSSQQPLLREFALVAGGQWNIEAIRPAIVSNATAGESDQVRQAAFRAITASQDKSLRDALVQVTSDPKTSMHLRLAALEALARVEPQKASSVFGAMLTALSASDSAAAVTRAFLSHRNGTELLNASLSGRSLNSDVARDLLRTLRESGRSAPELEATLRTAGKISSRKLLSPAERADLLRRAAALPSAAAGESVYRNGQLGCLKCHAIGGSGGLVGPDMVSLGASAQPDYLLDSLLDPNAKVKENYHTTVVATTDGKVVSGIQIQQSESSLTLRTAENKILTIARNEIEETVPGVSLMPEGLMDTLTDDELAALVRFLSELGRTPEYSISRQRFARTWQVMRATEEAAFRLRRTSYAQSAVDDPAFDWIPQYSRVNGELPVTDIPVVTPQAPAPAVSRKVGFARTEIHITSPGTFVFRLKHVEGLALRIDDKPVDVATEFSVALSAGVHRMTFVVDQAVRSDVLRLELVDSPDSTGIAEFRN